MSKAFDKLYRIRIFVGILFLTCMLLAAGTTRVMAGSKKAVYAGTLVREKDYLSGAERDG